MKLSQEQKPKRSVKSGDLYKLGQHLLLCGDSTSKKDVNTLLDGIQVNLLLTDPPYGVSYVESKSAFHSVHKAKEIHNDQEQTEEEYIAFTENWLKPAAAHLAKPNTVYIFNSDKMLFALREAMKHAGIKFSQLLIWIKHQAVVGRLDYLPQHELIIYGWKGTHRFERSKDKSVLFCPKPSKSTLHPTMKPIGLLRRLILNSTKIGDIVYEPFGGSGSTLIACEQTKRICRAIEIDAEYCNSIITRWEQASKQEAQFIKNIYA